MSDEKLTPERAVRLLRAKGAELEQYVLDSVPVRPFDPMVLVADVAQFAADIALIAQLLADHIEANQTVRITGPEASGTKYSQCGPECSEGHTYRSPCALAPVASVENNEHIIDLQPGGWMIQHPLQERLDGSLFDCLVTWDSDINVYGRFVLVWDDTADSWVLGKKL